MVKESFSNSLIVNYDGLIMRFGAIKHWIEMSDMEIHDIHPATKEEIETYYEMQKRET